MRKSDRQVEAAADQTRRAVIAGAGVVGASVLLSGCGDTANLKNRFIADGQTTAPAPPPATKGAAKAPAGKPPAKKEDAKPAAPPVDRLAATSDIPVGGGKIFSDDKVVVTQPTAGTFKAYDTTCTHAGCAVTKITGGTINCPCHGAKFNVKDGSVAAGPAPSPLKEIAITVDGDNIQLA